MCRDCCKETAFVKVNDDVIAEVTYDNYEYDEDEEYTAEQLDEKIELKVVNLWMTRKTLRDNIGQVFI